ncbi:MAG: ribbon-helix-helix protein, CopG family [Thermomicrobiales bacterium]|nr:ribbon-helix-helix protein, CopG family [Thermomicrobiales bacterium]
MATTTTIRVTTDVREHLAKLARNEGKTTGQLIEDMIREHEKKVFFEGLAEDFRRLRSDPEKWALYQSEVALWDTALMDGLEDEPPWED